jgi:hypothetical protein
MQILTGTIFAIMVLGALVLAGWIIIGFFKILMNISARPTSTRSTTDASDEIDGMNNGDYYNGPGGYHATGGYENSFYGQIYDHDEEDEHH